MTENITAENITAKKIEVAREMRSNRYRCSQVCSCYNSVDRDCEIYGSQSLPPSKCGWFLEREALRRLEDDEVL